MILLDTNVLSAFMRREDESTVYAWLNAQPAESIWTTAITVFEVRFGIELLAEGRRRRTLETLFATALDEGLDGRVVPFDQMAAESAGVIAAQRLRIGRPMEARDVQIAGTAAARKATLATRNVSHFEGLGISIVDPWTA